MNTRVGFSVRAGSFVSGASGLHEWLLGEFSSVYPLRERSLIRHAGNRSLVARNGGHRPSADRVLGLAQTSVRCRENRFIFSLAKPHGESGEWLGPALITGQKSRRAANA